MDKSAGLPFLFLLCAVAITVSFSYTSPDVVAQPPTQVAVRPAAPTADQLYKKCLADIEVWYEKIRGYYASPQFAQSIIDTRAYLVSAGITPDSEYTADHFLQGMDALRDSARRFCDKT